MIMRLQALFFLLFGMAAWHGVDEHFQREKAKAVADVLMHMNLAQLSNIEIGG